MSMKPRLPVGFRFPLLAALVASRAAAAAAGLLAVLLPERGPAEDLALGTGVLAPECADLIFCEFFVAVGAVHRTTLSPTCAFLAIGHPGLTTMRCKMLATPTAVQISRAGYALDSRCPNI